MAREGYPELSDYIDYLAYFQEHIKECHLSGKQLTGLCPFHTDTKASFSVNIETSEWNCFKGCGSGNITEFHAKLKSCDNNAAYKDLCILYNIPRPGAGGNNGNGSRPAAKPATVRIAGGTAQPDTGPPEIPEETWAKFTPFDEQWYAHFQSVRGWSREIIDRLDLRKATHYWYKAKLCRARSVERVAIPVRDAAGKLRNIRSYHPRPTGKEQKIMSWAAGYGDARNFPAVPFKEDGPVYLCEGEPDTLCARSFGLNAITHTSKPKDYPEELKAPFAGRDVIICYDADKPGQHYALVSAIALGGTAKSIKFLQWPDYMGRTADGQWPDKGGQDLTDFFIKHKKTLEDFLALPLKDFDPAEVERNLALKVPPSVAKAVADLNARHAVIMIGGKCLILNEDVDPDTGQPDVSFSSVHDFRTRYANQYVEFEVRGGDGGTRVKQQLVSELWLASPDRRQYQGITFSPGKAVPGYRNLWQGFAIQPKPGDWSLFRDFISAVICGGIDGHYAYLLSWMARLVQEPGGERPGVAVVLRGRQGCGKGTFTNLLGRLFGGHYLAISQPSQIVGRFNSHLKDKVLLFFDEGFWAGDKSGEGVIKSLITEPYIAIEGKGRDVVRFRNHVNVVIASNATWVVPAGPEERRFFFLDVSPKHQQDHEFFKSIYRQMFAGGLEAMLHDLLLYDHSKVNLRQAPKTGGLFEQILASMSTARRFWFQRLKDESGTGWPSWVASDSFFAEYLEFCERHHDRYPLMATQFFLELRRLCPGILKERRRAGEGVRFSGWRIPPLEECRVSFSDLIGMPVDWDDDGREAARGNEDRVPF